MVPRRRFVKKLARLVDGWARHSYLFGRRKPAEAALASTVRQLGDSVRAVGQFRQTAYGTHVPFRTDRIGAALRVSAPGRNEASYNTLAVIKKLAWGRVTHIVDPKKTGPTCSIFVPYALRNRVFQAGPPSSLIE